MIAAVIGFAIIQVFAHHSGIGISPDSVTYISAARNLNLGRGLIGFDNTPLVDFPALYSIFLGSIAFITKLDPVIFGPILNGSLFALLIYLCGAIMNGFYFFSGWYKRILLSCFVLAPCLLEVYSMLWSETLFLLLSIFFIITIRNYFQKHTIGSLIGLSVVAALACVTRYAGITLLCTGVLLLILDIYPKTGRKIIHVIIFSIIASSLLFLNILRNISVSGVATGARQKGNISLIHNIYFFGNILNDWLPVTKNNLIAFIITIACIAVCIIIFLLRFRDPAAGYSYESIAAAFCSIYAVFMLVSATFSRYEQFTNRLLSPLFIPLIWSLSYWFPSFLNKFTLLKRSGMIGLGLLLMAVFQNHQLAADYETYDGIKDAGIPGYTEDPFPQSDILIFMQKNKGVFKPGYPVYSNAGDAFYFFTGLVGHLLPQIVFTQSIQKFYNEDHHYLVWFNDVDNPDLLSLQNILDHKKMTLIQQFNSGAIYVYEKK